MTVHASKGLEAPIVFLADTCRTASSGPDKEPLIELPPPGGRDSRMSQSGPRIWLIKGASQVAAVQAAKQAKADMERQEQNRLLYVAMTRARDRLYVTGFEGKKARKPECWYDLIC